MSEKSATIACWRCKAPAVQTGYWSWVEWVAVERFIDGDLAVLDQQVEMIAFCFRCPRCRLGFITDIAGIGLGTEESYGGPMERDSRWRRLVADPPQTKESQ